MTTTSLRPERAAPDFYHFAPVWDRTFCPESHHLAKPSDWIYVVDQWVIEVSSARYRLSSQSGLFLLASRIVSRRNMLREPRVGVYCRWFGHKLKSNGPIALRLVESQFSVIEKFSGWVITNLSL
jgi:hypothetical protein